MLLLEKYFCCGQVKYFLVTVIKIKIILFAKYFPLLVTSYYLDMVSDKSETVLDGLSVVSGQVS